MATTAKQSSSVRGSSSSPLPQSPAFSDDGEEDIETIAKQISDHAEAIYQTWKARGLAPTEILHCHTGNSDAFGKSLTPPSRNSHVGCISSGGAKKESSPVNVSAAAVAAAAASTVELFAQTPDMSNNNLEKLVSSFVNEDKARQQAARKSTSILTSGTIKDALRKFESVDRTSASSVKPNFLRTYSPQPTNVSQQQNHRYSAPPETTTDVTTNTTTTTAAGASPSSNYNNSKLSKNVPDVLMNTIDTTDDAPSKDNSAVISPSQSLPNKQKPETPAKPASLINHTPTWPLKNRLTLGAGSKKVTSSKEASAAKKAAEKSAKNAADLMDEVLIEEERLINALKTGTVLNNDKPLPEVITSTLGDSTWTKPAMSTVVVASPSTESSKIAAMPNSVPQQNRLNDMRPLQPHQLQDNVPSSCAGGGGGGLGANSTTGAIKITKQPRPRNDAAVPHPESLNSVKTNHGGVNVRGVSTTPAVRPFLTRGSVAERVLMFEKCPEVKALRMAPKEPSKLSTKPQPAPTESHTTLQRHIRSSKNVYIPKFYYPSGKPVLSIATEQTYQRLQAAFDSFPNKQATKENFTNILKICGLPMYWRMPFYACAQLTPTGLCDGKKFLEFWKQMCVYCHDPVSRFVFVLSRGQRSRPYILPEDLITLVQDVVDTHPGLAFLKEASEFHSRYVHTVIARIFYTVNRSWTGRITLPELRRSNLLQVLQLLEEEEDINQIMAYFSYEHFYVIYCKFWELDRDHDLFIDQNDLARHNDHALSTRIIERIFSGCVTKGAKSSRASAPLNAAKMSYTEFVWFLLSEEDKTHPTAVEYWFRCMDIDGDGILSMYELEYFYEEQQHRMESIGIETLPFEDCLCQMLDMIKPKRPGFVTLGDLKRCKMTPIFFDTFFNLEKYMEHEQRDPFATQRDQEEMTDWDRYAAQEYELLVAEEGGDTQGSYDEDDEYESNIDILESQLDDCMSNMINEW